MKTLIKLLIGALVMISFDLMAQLTPEQQKKVEDAQKKALEMMENNPQIKAVMEQLKAQEAHQKAEQTEKQVQPEMENAETSTDQREKHYWRGKVASNNNGKFADWIHGEVAIAIYNGDGKMDDQQQYIDKKYIIVGGIRADGQVTINLPESIPVTHAVNTSLIPQMHSVSNNDVSFSNPNALYRNPGFALSVIKNYKSLGNLYLGNSERVTYNLAAPCCINYGDEGYRLYWVYIDDACTAKLHKELKQNKIYNGEAEKIVDQEIIYDLEFKPGWNLIKSEVVGNYMVGGIPYFRTKKHTVVSKMLSDTKYYFQVKDWHKY